MIPKKIHYCWFGGKHPPLVTLCIETWKKHLPDYEIKLWNEKNIPDNIPYVNKMLQEKKYAFASDYIRYYALYQEGGIYLDTDMEVIKSFDYLLNQDCFLGYEKKGLVNAASGVVGGVSNFHFFRLVMDAIVNNYEKTQQEETIPRIVTSLIKKENIENIKIYDIEYFYPYNPYDFSRNVPILMYKDITENTYAIHHWNADWEIKRKLSFRIKMFIKKIFRLE